MPDACCKVQIALPVVLSVANGDLQWALAIAVGIGIGNGFGILEYPRVLIESKLFA